MPESSNDAMRQPMNAATSQAAQAQSTKDNNIKGNKVED